MNIVILAGGTGSIALQTGLYDTLERVSEGVDIKVIVNAYDNGLSTGAVRKVLNGSILGPSDVRKNQTTRLKLQNSYSPLNSFLDERFTAAPADARSYCINKAAGLMIEKVIPYEKVNILSSAIEAYFSLPMASKIDYNDFALANIIYAGLAAQNNNSLRKAASIMAGILDIKDNVLLNDDTSLFLGAITKSGHHITDEGDIVAWNNPNDPIVDIFFTDEHGQETQPVLNEESISALLNADLIILSSGTQWSSLIPTYYSKGFIETIEKSKARVVMVMNRIPDKDAPDQSASDIIRTLVPRFFPKDKLEVIVDNTGHHLMSSLDNDARGLIKTTQSFDLRPVFIEADDKRLHPKHHPQKLALSIAKTYFSDVLDAKSFVFDYDDTLIGRGNSFPIASAFNAKSLSSVKIKTYICSGNSIKAIKLNGVPAWRDDDSETSLLTVFADGGINEYTYDPCSTIDEEQHRFTFVRCLVEDAKIPATGPFSVESFIKALCAVGLPAAKIENRGDVMITVKPIDPEYREPIRCLIESICASSGYIVKSAGRTTIEIHKATVTKEIAVREILKTIHTNEQLVYVGDELDHGNDSPVKTLAANDNRVKCVSVRSPADTAFLFLALSPNSINLIHG